MLEEVIIVTKIEAHQFWGHKQTSSCQSCTKICTNPLVNQFIPSSEISLKSELVVKVGDRLLIGIEEAAMIKATLILYCLPLLALFIGAGLGVIVALFLGLINSDGIITITALSFFLMSFPLLSYWQKGRYFKLAKVIRKLD